MKYLIVMILLFFVNTNHTPVSDPDYFSPPLKIPLVLSGNFGELRANHFHSGIDIKTEGKTGLEVYAAAEGDVSRIFISPTGFGHALYIDHPNGTTTVYGHLLRFNDDLAAYAKAIEYQKESFSIDIPVPKGMFHFDKGDLIAYSGDTGSSGGPHLHFEVRKTESEHPVNPLFYNFDIPDDMAPQIQSVMFYPLSDDAHVSGSANPQRVETVYYEGAYHLKSNPTLSVYGDIGFGIQTFDYLDGSWSKCGVYEIDLSVDGKMIYEFQMDELDFDETRYLNSHIDYSQYQQYGRQLHKSWVEPGNLLNNYPLLVNHGEITLDDGKTHTISYLVKDAKGNSSKLSFNVLSKQMDLKHESPEGIPFYYDRANTVRNEKITATFEPGTFYSDFNLEYEEKPANNLYYSPIFKLGSSDIPVQQYFEISIKPDNLPLELFDKALIATISSNGRAWALGGSYSNGQVTASVRELGNFTITVDTVAPTITPVNIRSNSTLTNRNKISFKINDDFSGISTYRGEIDGKWVLFEYDSKNNLLEYYFDSDYLTLNTNHQLKLVVTDVKNNVATYEANFYR